MGCTHNTCDDQSVNNVFLIGGGFTHAVFPCRAPLNKGLLRALIRKRANTPLKTYRKAYGTDEIESLLTRLDLEINGLGDSLHRAPRRRLRSDRHKIDRELAEFFEQFRFGKCQNAIAPKKRLWLDMFAQEALRRHDVVITLNYDCFLEGLLDSHSMWCPSTGYGPVRTPVPGSEVGTAANLKSILVYKIHGSENFRSLPKRYDKRGEVMAEVNGEIFPRSGEASLIRVYHGRTRVIAPSFVKQLPRQMQSMMVMALQAARLATNMIIIGCGLRPEDNHLWLLLASFAGSPTSRKRVVVIDKNADAIRRRIRTEYGPGLSVGSLGQGRGLDQPVIRRLIKKLYPEK
jgi:hypothetical protein